MFMYKDKAVKTPEGGDKAKADEIFDIWSYIGIGELLLLLSLTCDGLTGAVQVNFSCSIRLSNMQNKQVYLTELGLKTESRGTKKLTEDRKSKKP